MSENRRKVVIVGAGSVGSTFAYALAQAGIAEEIVICDLNEELMKGQVLDLAHGMPFYPPVKIRCGSAEDYADANVIVITAGAKQKSGESRLDLLKKNAGIIEGIVDDITAQKATGVILVVSNPVDVLTYVALQHSGWPKERVIGSGTVLDSSRFRFLLSRHCNVDVHNTHAYILGEHGDSEFAAWSLTNIAGMPINDYCPICAKCENWEKERNEVAEQVRKSAYHVIDYKGATFYAVGLALVRIVSAILLDRRSVLTVSTRLEGTYGFHNVCLSLPCIVSRHGVEKIVESHLNAQELDSLKKSVGILQDAIAQLNI